MPKPDVSELKREHLELADRVRESDDPHSLMKEMVSFLKTLTSAGSEVRRSDDRELLRSLASLWAGRIYEYSETGHYPSSELETYTGTPSIGEVVRDAVGSVLGRPGSLLLAIFTALVFVALGALTGVISLPLVGSPSATPIAVATKVTVIPFNTPSPSADEPTVTATPAPSPSPVQGDTATPPSLSGIDVLLVKPSDGEPIFPTTFFQGTYSNLESGWKIYPILQPISEGGRLYPITAPFTVPAGFQSGTWAADPELFARPEIADGEQYNILLALALDDLAAQVLDLRTQQGFSSFGELPATVIRLPSVVTVSIEAFERIDQVRLVYAQQTKDEVSSEIITSLPDGSDLRQVTFTPGLVEIEPNLSPDGEQIIYVGRTENALDGFAFSLQIIDASGRNPTLLLAAPDTLYDRPVWSPDGRFIAYGAQLRQGSEQIWQVFVYDLASDETISVTEGYTSLRHPSWFPDGRALLLQGWSTSSETWGFFKLELETGAVGVLYDTEDHEVHPELSSDGSLVAFVSFPDGTTASHDILVLEIETNEARRLTTDRGVYWEPTWRPDQQSIYFENFEASGTASIWAVDISGGGDRRIIEGSAFALFPNIGRLSAYLPANQ